MLDEMEITNISDILVHAQAHGESVIGLVLCRKLPPLPLPSDMMLFSHVQQAIVVHSQFNLLIMISDLAHQAFGLPRESQPHISYSPCTFVDYVDDGVSGESYNPRRVGGHTFMADSDETRATCLCFIEQHYGDALARLDRDVPPCRLDMLGVLACLVSAAFAAVGPVWPLRVVVGWPSDMIRITKFQMQGSLPQTFVVPLGIDSPDHWALLCIRKPASTRIDWDVVLIDSMRTPKMEHEAYSTMAQLRETFAWPDDVGNEVRTVEAAQQKDSWSCGQRVALHAFVAFTAPMHEILDPQLFVENDTQHICALLSKELLAMKAALRGPQNTVGHIVT